MHEFPEPDESNTPWDMGGDAAGGQPDEPLPYDPGTVDEAFLRSPEDSDIPLTSPDALAGEQAQERGSPASVRQRCIEEATSVVADALEAGGSLAGYEPGVIGTIVTDMATDAAARGDIARVDRYADMVTDLGPMLDLAAVRICYAGLEAGSTNSHMILTVCLSEEQTAIQEQLEQAQENGEIGRLPVEQPLLRAVVQECMARDTSPEAWIRDRAADDEMRWQLLAEYYSKVSQGEGDSVVYYETQLDQRVGELLVDGKFEPGFQRDEVLTGLSYTDNAGLREQLVARYLNVIADQPLTWDSFQNLVSIGTEVVNDNNLATRENIDDFSNLIDQSSAVFDELGMPSYLIMSTTIAYDAAIARRFNTDPRHVVDEIDSRVSGILHFAVPDDSPAQGAVAKMRDRMVGEYAKDAFTQGKNADAAAYLASVVQEDIVGDAYKDCLDAATTIEQIDAIQPDELTMSLTTGLARQFDFAKARVENDAGTMRSLAVAYAEGLATGEDAQALSYIRQAYEAVAAIDGPQSQALARDALAIMRAAHTPHTFTRFLSEVLIGAGDQDEPQRAYDADDIPANDPSGRLLKLWNLGRAIRIATPEEPRF